MKRHIALLLGLVVILSLLCGCDSGEKPSENSTEASGNSIADETSEGEASVIDTTPVTITIVGPWEDCTAVEVTGREFTKQYPNCTIEYEYLQNFEASLPVRLDENNDIDLFFTNGITATSEIRQYAVDLKSAEGFDLSETFAGLTENAVAIDEGVERIYALPLGAEMRGLYVNKTLLDSLNIAVPTNQETLLAACAKLKENGYVPLNANPGSFAQHLLYPWICNIVANAEDYEAVHAALEARGDGLSELFRDPFEFLYLLVENGYYNYKAVQNESGLFVDASDPATCRDFLNVKKTSSESDEYAFEPGIGRAPFVTGTLSLKGIMDKTKADYHSTIEYVFVPAPVGPDGGFVYLSPSRSVAANKNSEDKEWSIRFLDFLFTPEHNETFANAFNVVPNTKEAFAYISKLYTVPADRISQVGQVSFSTNYFYTAVKDVLVALSKANNPSYMVLDENGKYINKDGEKCSMNPLSVYMEQLEKSLKGE